MQASKISQTGDKSVMNSAVRRRLLTLLNSVANENMNDFRICSENSLIAADSLRSALTNLNKARDLMQQLLIDIKRADATSTRES
jgi:hypothetical protein